MDIYGFTDPLQERFLQVYSWWTCSAWQGKGKGARLILCWVPSCEDGVNMQISRSLLMVTTPTECGECTNEQLYRVALWVSCTIPWGQYYLWHTPHLSSIWSNPLTCELLLQHLEVRIPYKLGINFQICFINIPFPFLCAGLCRTFGPHKVTAKGNNAGHLWYTPLPSGVHAWNLHVLPSPNVTATQPKTQ